ncbi:MAG: type II toxin-antitoxin system VapC family toxin [Planctomycetota bacterium]
MLVLDNSVSMSWCFENQRTDYATAVLKALIDGCAVVPALWLLEVANVTSLAEQKGLLAATDRRRFLQLLLGLRTQVDHANAERIWGDVFDLALAHRITAYDARYLELAKRLSLPLASADTDLKAAAKKERVRIFEGS